MNERTKEVIPFATVIFLNTKIGVSADANGVFKLEWTAKYDTRQIEAIFPQPALFDGFSNSCTYCCQS